MHGLLAFCISLGQPFSKKCYFSSKRAKLGSVWLSCSELLRIWLFHLWFHSFHAQREHPVTISMERNMPPPYGHMQCHGSCLLVERTEGRGSACFLVAQLRAIHQTTPCVRALALHSDPLGSLNETLPVLSLFLLE